MANPTDEPSDESVASSVQELKQHVPVKFRSLCKLLEARQWSLVRITGSHHIFEKVGKRCIPVAFHGGSITKRYAERVCRQAGILTNESDASLVLEEEEACHHSRDSTKSAELKIDELEYRDPKRIVRIPGQKALSCVREQEKQMRAQLEQNKEKEAADLESRRIGILEDIQNSIALEDYNRALDKINIENVGTVGSSDSSFSFTSDLMFYKIVAMTELAFMKHAFGSEAQQDYIWQATKACVSYSKNYPERRKETREFISALQGRLIRSYGSTWWSLCVECLGNADPAKFPHAYTEKMLMISLYNGEYKKEAQISEMVLFVTGQHGECMDEQTQFDKALATAFNLPPPECEVSQALLRGLAFLTKELAEVYMSAPQELSWIRFAASLDKENVEDISAQHKQGYNFDTVLRFTSMVLDSICSCKQRREVLLSSNQTKKFMLDILLDPTCILRLCTLSLMSNKSGPLGEKGVQIRSQITSRYNESIEGGLEMDLRTYISLHERVTAREFRNDRYDKARRYVLKFYAELQRIESLCDFEYCEAYGQLFRKNESIPQRQLLMRFVMLPEVRSNVAELTSMIFDDCSKAFCLVNILKQILELRTMIDMAKYFDKVNKLKAHIGHCRSKQEVLAQGQWIFHHSIINFLPGFLVKFCPEDLKTRLCVIDRMGVKTCNTRGAQERERDNVLGRGNIYLEAFSFQFLSRLLAIKEGEISKQSVREYLNNILADETRPTSLRQHIKRKSLKYEKKLDIFGCRARAQSEALSNCLRVKQACVDSLLQKLERTVISMLPFKTEAEVDNAASEYDPHRAYATLQLHEIVEATAQLHVWTRRELQELYRCMMDLEDATEKVTSFLHQLTGTCFPVARSLMSPLWTQKDSEAIHWGDYNKSQLNAIHDIMCLDQILHVHETTKSE